MSPIFLSKFTYKRHKMTANVPLTPKVPINSEQISSFSYPYGSRVQKCLPVSVHIDATVLQRTAGVWVYLSPDPGVGDEQRRTREALLNRHLGLLAAQLARRLQGHVPPITLPQVSAVFERPDLSQAVILGGSADC